VQARTWVATELKVDPDTSVNLFETTIRVLGGLLAAFHLSNGDKVMLYKAAALALRLLPAFNSETGMQLLACDTTGLRGTQVWLCAGWFLPGLTNGEGGGGGDVRP